MKTKLLSIYRLLFLFIIVAAILGLVFGCSKNKVSNPPPVDDDPPPPIETIVYSNYIGDDLRIYVGLPEDYDSARSEPYHAIYLLDGDDFFDEALYGWPERTEPLGEDGVWGMLRRMHIEDSIPPVVLVSIGYEGTGPNMRRRDFYSRFTSFQNFLLFELIPMVDSIYNTHETAGRTLVGHSLGGVAAMQFFCSYGNSPDHPFENYVVASGDFNYSAAIVFPLETTMASRLGSGADLPLNLYMAVGDEDDVELVQGNMLLNDSISARGYQQFNYEFEVFPGIDHYLVRQGFAAGFRSVF